MEKYIFDSKIGNIRLFYTKEYLYKIELTLEHVTKNKPCDYILEFISDFTKYLNGETIQFSIPYKIDGTDFQRRVLKQILLIKHGETISYSELARRSGYTKASRAVGTVCKNNKLPILIPCHRVIKSNGEAGQYSLGNSIKLVLLSLEKQHK